MDTLERASDESGGGSLRCSVWMAQAAVGLAAGEVRGGGDPAAVRVGGLLGAVVSVLSDGVNAGPLEGAEGRTSGPVGSGIGGAVACSGGGARVARGGGILGGGRGATGTIADAISETAGGDGSAARVGELVRWRRSTGGSTRVEAGGDQAAPTEASGWATAGLRMDAGSFRWAVAGRVCAAPIRVSLFVPAADCRDGVASADDDSAAGGGRWAGAIEVRRGTSTDGSSTPAGRTLSASAPPRKSAESTEERYRSGCGRVDSRGAVVATSDERGGERRVLRSSRPSLVSCFSASLGVNCGSMLGAGRSMRAGSCSRAWLGLSCSLLDGWRRRTVLDHSRAVCCSSRFE